MSLAILLLADAASALANHGTIKLNARIGPVALFETKTHVRAHLGRRVPVRLGGQIWSYYKRRGLYVLYGAHPSVVVGILTRSSRYRTSSGVGVGTSLGTLRRRVKVKCYPRGSIEPCQHGYRNDKSGTSFLVKAATHRVIAVRIDIGG